MILHRHLDEMDILKLESAVFGDCSEKERGWLSERFRDAAGSVLVLFDPLSTTAFIS